MGGALDTAPAAPAAPSPPSFPPGLALPPPHPLAALRLCPNVSEPLRRLQAAGFDLFIVSNQPSHAKGRASLEDIRAIARAVEDRFRAAGVTFRAAYYCHHHPLGIVPAYSGP